MDSPQQPDTFINIKDQELNIADLVMAAWKIYTENLSIIVLITLAVFLPLNIISMYLPGADASGETLNTSSAIGLGISSLLVALVGVLVPAAIAYIVSLSLDRQPIKRENVFRFALSRWLPLIGTSLLMMVFLLGLTFLFVIPAIILGVYWAFATYVVVLKNKSGMDALRYSQSVVKGRWWKVIGYLIIFGFITGMISWLISLPFVNINNHIINALVSTLSDIIFSYTIVATALFFINLDNVRRVTESKQQSA